MTAQSISIGEGFRIFKRQDGRSKFWGFAYYKNGKEHRESLKTEDENKARKTADAKMSRIKTSRIDPSVSYYTPEQRNKKISALLNALENKFQLRGILSAQNRSQIKRVREDFGGYKALNLSASDVDDYAARRLEEGDAKASINRTTQILGQAYRLAGFDPPKFTRLPEAGNERRGFFSEGEVRRVIANLPEHLRDFVLFGYLTGMRKGEIASLEWADLDGDVLTLTGDDAKNGEARSIPIVGELAEVIERRRAARQFKVKETITLSNLIFHRSGLPIAEFRKSWASAAIAAGVGKLVCPKCAGSVNEKHKCASCSAEWKREDLTYTGRIFHDLRRSAVRDLIRSGVSQTVAMSISGHKTASMFSRYNITDDRDQREALLMRQQYLRTVKEKVAAMPAH